MNTPKLELSQIEYTIKITPSNHLPILDNIGLHVNKKEFVTLLGPSGCGKSTLLQIVGGVIKPTQGQVKIDDTDVTGRKGWVSYMPQQPALFPWRTVIENVILAREIGGANKKESIALGMEWLDRFGLSGYEHFYPEQLSGGMAQRVALLRALLSAQELMCLDEPFASLDILNRTNMQEWLTKIWEENQRSVLFITHSIDEAIYLSDRIYVMSPKPSHIIKELAIPFPRPRQFEIRYDKQFISMKEEIYRMLQPNEERI